MTFPAAVLAAAACELLIAPPRLPNCRPLTAAAWLAGCWGALQVVSLGRVVPRTKPQHTYVHVACALWTPEMTLAQPEQMKGVQLEHMTALRAELQCALCKQTGGAVV